MRAVKGEVFFQFKAKAKEMERKKKKKYMWKTCKRWNFPIFPLVSLRVMASNEKSAGNHNKNARVAQTNKNPTKKTNQFVHTGYLLLPQTLYMLIYATFC